MSSTHDAGIIDSDVFEQFIELDILLRVGIDQIVKLHPCDGQHRRAIELGIVKAVKQMNTARAGSCQRRRQAFRLIWHMQLPRKPRLLRGELV